LPRPCYVSRSGTLQPCPGPVRKLLLPALPSCSLRVCVAGVRATAQPCGSRSLWERSVYSPLGANRSLRACVCFILRCTLRAFNSGSRGTLAAVRPSFLLQQNSSWPSPCQPPGTPPWQAARLRSVPQLASPCRGKDKRSFPHRHAPAS